jgi:hypothetical protein
MDADLVQTGNSVSGTARITEGQEVFVGTVSGTVNGSASLNINFGAFGVMAATISVSSGNAVGSYSLTTPTDPATGVVALTLSPGLTTPTNLSGLWFGTSLNSGSGGSALSSEIFVLQTGNSIYFSTLWNNLYIYDGTGTIIGNKITFQVTQTDFITGAAQVMNGSATINGNVISGITVVGVGGSTSTVGAFSVTFAEALQP